MKSMTSPSGETAALGIDAAIPGQAARRSTAEQAVRDAVVARIRVALPRARIIHELNVAGTGSNRIDVAAVTLDRLFAFELKSEKDTLDRWPEQQRAFEACAHHVIVVAHRRHFQEDKSYAPPRFVWPFGEYETNVWMFPEPEPSGTWPLYNHRWHLPKDKLIEPHAYKFLNMLWRNELFDLAQRFRLGLARRATRHDAIVEIALNCTGAEIATGVCAALRARTFVEADPPFEWSPS